MKTKVLTLTVVAIALFASCQKSEGIYNPNKKISKLYEEGIASWTIGDNTQEISTGKNLSEEWTWTGDKLSRIDQFSPTGELESSNIFTYDGDVLVRTDYGDNSHTDFIYDGKKISEIKNYEGDVLSSVLAVTKRDGKKITEMTATTYPTTQPNSKTTHQLQNVLGLLIPESAAECIAHAAKQHVATKGDPLVSNITLTWTGNNITKIEATDPSANMYMVYAYDNKKSPTKGFIDYLTGYISMNEWGSKNNSILDSIVAYNQGEMYYNTCARYTYEYDGDWPVKRTYSTVVESASATSIRYYEYKD